MQRRRVAPALPQDLTSRQDIGNNRGSQWPEHNNPGGTWWISAGATRSRRSGRSAGTGSPSTSRSGLPSGDTREGFAAHLEWERQLFERPLGGGVAGRRPTAAATPSLWEWLIFEEEYYRAGAPQRVTQNGIFLLAPTIFEFGTPAQQDHYLPRMAAAEDLWCQGWSEPNAGSDLAGHHLASGARRRRRVAGD